MDTIYQINKKDMEIFRDSFWAEVGIRRLALTVLSLKIQRKNFENLFQIFFMLFLFTYYMISYFHSPLCFDKD